VRNWHYKPFGRIVAISLIGNPWLAITEHRPFSVNVVGSGIARQNVLMSRQRPHRRFQTFQFSLRRVVMGSTRVARRAGM